MNAPTPTIHEVVEPFANAAEGMPEHVWSDACLAPYGFVLVGDFRRARTFLESIPADGGTVKALDPAIVSALAAYLAQYRDKALKGIELERWAHGVVRALGGVVDERHTAAGAGPVGEAVAKGGQQ